VLTGGELINYIIKNNLTNEPVFKDNVFVGFVTEDEVAVKMEVGIYTVRMWINQGLIDAIKLMDIIYIPYNYEEKLKKALEERKSKETSCSK
jgi:hypothetical protein